MCVVFAATRPSPAGVAEYLRRLNRTVVQIAVSYNPKGRSIIGH
jgi:cytochrome b